MYSLSVKNDRGEVLDLTQNQNYTLYKIEGLAPPGATVNKSANTTIDGDTINSVRMESRNIVLYINLNREIEKSRIELYKYLPPKREVTIYFKNDTRDVQICGVVETIECDLFTKNEIMQISIVCPKPYFKSADELTTMFCEISPLFEFPFAIEKEGIPFSELTPNIRKSIVYTGDAETGIVMELFAASGTVTNPIIYDVLERTHIKINMTMQQSDMIIINTNVGEKSIQLLRNGKKSNAMGFLTPDSQWLGLQSGENVFTYTCEAGASNLQITFKTNVLYSGV